MTISVKVPVIGQDGKVALGQDGKPITKGDSLPVTSVEFILGTIRKVITGKDAERVGQAVYESPSNKGCTKELPYTQAIISKLPAEVVINVYHAGYSWETLKVNKATPVKTHSMTVGELKARLAGKEVQPKVYDYAASKPATTRSHGGSSSGKPIEWTM